MGVLRERSLTARNTRVGVLPARGTLIKGEQGKKVEMCCWNHSSRPHVTLATQSECGCVAGTASHAHPASLAQGPARTSPPFLLPFPSSSLLSLPPSALRYCRLGGRYNTRVLWVFSVGILSCCSYVFVFQGEAAHATKSVNDKLLTGVSYLPQNYNIQALLFR